MRLEKGRRQITFVHSLISLPVSLPAFPSQWAEGSEDCGYNLSSLSYFGGFTGKSVLGNLYFHCLARTPDT